MKKNLFIPLICLTAASITTLSISYADTASSKEKNYAIEETSTESETEIESGSDENVPLKPLSDIAPNKHNRLSDIYFLAFSVNLLALLFY